MSPREYVKAIKRIEILINLDQNSDSEIKSELTKLVSEVEAYESRIYPMARVLPELLFA